MIWFKRILISIIALAGIAFIGFHLFKTQIAMRAFEGVIDKNAGVDRSASLSDGLHVYLCGTGSPMPDPSRAGPCLGVLAGDDAFIFDVGAGGPRNLGTMGFPIARLQSVYLTHLHSDHIDGLGELLLNSWIAGGRSTPTPIRGPEGTQEIVDGFNAAYRLDSTYRIAHHGAGVANPDGFGGAATEIKIPAASEGTLVVLDEGDLRITAIRVDHAPIEPAFGFRIDYKDRSISISGDTVYSEEFIAGSARVDLMFHEALNRDMVSQIGTKLGERGVVNGAKIFTDILDYHTSPEEAARAAQEAGAEQLVLYHIVPQLPVEMLEPLFLGDANSEYNGPITIGQDGMIFSLPAGTNTVEQSKTF